MTEATPEKRKTSGLVRGLQIVVGILVAIIVLGAIVGEDKDAPAPATASSQGQVQVQADEPVVEEPTSNLTGPQQNALRSAEQYIGMSGFSRDGLIDQLSSDAGEGYELSDATIAVDSLTVDWNEQAVRSATQYLKMSGFSCKGLIDQLSSDYGEKFTKSQATYGAQQAGAC